MRSLRSGRSCSCRASFRLTLNMSVWCRSRVLAVSDRRAADIFDSKQLAVRAISAKPFEKDGNSLADGRSMVLYDNGHSCQAQWRWIGLPSVLREFTGETQVRRLASLGGSGRAVGLPGRSRVPLWRNADSHPQTKSRPFHSPSPMHAPSRASPPPFEVSRIRGDARLSPTSFVQCPESLTDPSRGSFVWPIPKGGAQLIAAGATSGFIS